jgi:uncharacterized membrane protein
MHLLFWLSVIPFVTAWMGQNGFAQVPVALYGCVLILCGFAYSLLTKALLAAHDHTSVLRKAIGGDFKGNVSLLIYLVAIAVSFLSPIAACVLYGIVAVIWLVPDRRIERHLSHEGH